MVIWLVIKIGSETKSDDIKNKKLTTNIKRYSENEFFVVDVLGTFEQLTV
jgi:hypothetical protein